jgi:hypothetical protein
MSTTVKDESSPVGIDAQHAISAQREVHPAHWKGFVAGVFSGVAKLTGSNCSISCYGIETDSFQWGIRMSTRMRQK